MKFLSLVFGSFSLATLASGLHEPDPEAAAVLKNTQYKQAYQKKILDTLKKRKTGCTLKTVQRRREWGTLSKKERLSYIDAVYCLARKPTTFPASILAGAKTRYDDFTGTHLLQTDFVHFDGLFLGFHRYFVHLYEKALREECGYKGTQPYWDWSLSWKDPRKSTVLDGSPWSFGNNGRYIPNREPISIPLAGDLGEAVFPPGTGGGCIYQGPFTDFKMHLGPVLISPSGPQNGRGYNPRCIIRDVSLEIASNVRPSNISRVLGTPNLEQFNLVLDDPTGVHSGGHFMLGGMQLDPYVSPSDPIFWVHHGMIDHLWSVWQGQDQQTRQGQVWGTGTTGNIPPSPNVTLDSLINFEVLASPRPIRDVVSTIDGPFCYIYE